MDYCGVVHSSDNCPARISSIIYFNLTTCAYMVHCCYTFPTSRNSDDNLLKNIELFDKLSVRFSSRIKFMKDIVGRGEICCWAFYGQGRKVAEVCCESIVYATDRKHTKIEFPEAKILEETLNITLYVRREDSVYRPVEHRCRHLDLAGELLKGFYQKMNQDNE